MKRRVAALALTLVTSLCVAGCGDDGPKIVVYNAQHEQLLEEIAPAFTEKTGIEVELRNGSDLELADQLVQEGDASPADVFLTENSPAMSLVERAGLFAPLDEETLDPIPAQYRPASGLWTGFAARSTVLVYNTDHRDRRPSCPTRSWTSPTRSGPGGSPSPRPAPTSRPS